MKKVFMIIAAMCMTSIMASAQKTIRVSTDKTDLVMQVSPKGRLYQVYLGDKLKNPSDYNHLKWDVYAASDGSVCQRGHEVYATSGAEDFFEPAVAVTHADGNMTTYLYYQSSEEKAISGGVETIITLNPLQPLQWFHGVHKERLGTIKLMRLGFIVSPVLMFTQ